jgi:hypothetical protein
MRAFFEPGGRFGGTISPVTYDLAFWVGPRPVSNRAAAATYEEIFDRLDEAEDVQEPPERITSLIGELERRWPPFDEGSPWAVAPLGHEDATGDTLYVCLVLGRPEEDLRFMAQTAHRLGIVCFDPQSETVL